VYALLAVVWSWSDEQLRKINMSLRQQARAGTVYAPGGLAVC
jgi:hypothetical protein